MDATQYTKTFRLAPQLSKSVKLFSLYVVRKELTYIHYVQTRKTSVSVVCIYYSSEGAHVSQITQTNELNLSILETLTSWNWLSRWPVAAERNRNRFDANKFPRLLLKLLLKFFHSLLYSLTLFAPT